MDKKIKKFYEFINAPNITASNFPLYKLKAPSFLSDKDKPLEYQKRFYNEITTSNLRIIVAILSKLEKTNIW